MFGQPAAQQAIARPGDKFGEYCFKTPINIGDRVVFGNVGAYSLVKAHMFNGINLPDVWCQMGDGRLELVKRYTYEDFLDKQGVRLSENIRKRA